MLLRLIRMKKRQLNLIIQRTGAEAQRSQANLKMYERDTVKLWLKISRRFHSDRYGFVGDGASGVEWLDR